MKSIKFTKAKNDSNGNPRVIVHFLEFITPAEQESRTISEMYNFAAKKANKIGFTKYRGKDYGGGLIVQCYSEQDLENHINNLMRPIT